MASVDDAHSYGLYRDWERFQDDARATRPTAAAAALEVPRRSFAGVEASSSNWHDLMVDDELRAFYLFLNFELFLFLKLRYICYILKVIHNL